MTLKYLEKAKLQEITSFLEGKAVSQSQTLESKETLFGWMKAHLATLETHNEVCALRPSSFSPLRSA